MPILDLKLLGDFHVAHGMAGLVEISAKKSRALLAILALSPAGSVTRHRVANLLWGGASDQQARSSLRQALASLRRDLEAYDETILIADDEKITLSRDKLDIDVISFLRCADSDNIHDLREANGLYRGEFLADTEIAEAEFYDWASAERRRLHGVAVACAEKLFAMEKGGNRIALGKRLVDLEPLKEAAHYALMQAYYEADENGLALQHYAACSALLRSELGIPPGAAIEALRADILQQVPRSSTVGAVPKSQAEPDGALPILALPDKPSIAVLPFANLSGDPEQDYFADGVVEEIITALSQFNALFVIARNSSFIYKGRVVDVKQVGRELGVRYVLEGSVRKSGNRVRINGQLIDTATGAHLWAERFEGNLQDVFELQDQATATVVGSITPKLELAEIERTKRKPTHSLDAYDYFLRGMAGVHLWTDESTTYALSQFYLAIERDPNYAAAYGMAARCFVRRKTMRWLKNPVEENAEAIRLARRAVELGPADAVALCTGGFALLDFAHDARGGESLTDRAIVLNPNLAVAWVFSGWAKVALGQHDLAIERVTHAMRLSPHDSSRFSMQAAIACAHFGAGRYEEALSWAQSTLSSLPDFALQLSVEAASLALAGRMKEAYQSMARIREIAPDLTTGNLAEMTAFLQPDDYQKWENALRQAGLPEGTIGS